MDPTPGELSFFHNVRPPELALELAKQEKLEGPAKKFQAKILEKLKTEFLEYIKNNKVEIEKWIFQPLNSNDERYMFQQLFLHFYHTGELDSLRKIKHRLNESEKVFPRFEYDAIGNIKRISFDLGLPNNVVSIRREKYVPSSEIIYDGGVQDEDFAISDLPPTIMDGIEEKYKYQETKNIDYLSDADFDFVKFLRQAKHEDPEGFDAYVKIIVTDEEVDLERLVNRKRVGCEKINNYRLSLIKKGERAGAVFSELEAQKKLLEMFELQQKGLKKFRDSGFNLEMLEK